jgi:hypothetical protein
VLALALQVGLDGEVNLLLERWQWLLDGGLSARTHANLLTADVGDAVGLDVI